MHRGRRSWVRRLQAVVPGYEGGYRGDHGARTRSRLIPFCYGLVARPLRGDLEMLESVPYVLLLWALSYGVVVLITRSREIFAARLNSLTMPWGAGPRPSPVR